MSKQQKLLAKLCASPTPSDFKWADLVTLLNSLGYDAIKGKGAGRKFVHAKTKALIICHEPHPEPSVDKGCVRDVVQHLRDNRII